MSFFLLKCSNNYLDRHCSIYYNNNPNLRSTNSSKTIKLSNRRIIIKPTIPMLTSLHIPLSPFAIQTSLSPCTNLLRLWNEKYFQPHLVSFHPNWLGWRNKLHTVSKQWINYLNMFDCSYFWRNSLYFNQFGQLTFY